MSRPSPNLAAGLLDVFVSPASLFRALPEGRWWGWAAFALIIAASAISTYAFIGPMSPEWIVEQQILQMGDRLSDPELERIRPQLESMAPHTAAFSVIGAVATTGLMIVLVGSLYMLLARLATSGPRRGWGTWLRFTTWTQLPLVAYSLGLIVLALIAPGPDQPMSLLGYASLNNLVLDLPPGHRWYSMALGLSLFTLWSLVLATIGMRVWTNASTVRSALLAVVPWALVFGTWALIP